MNLQIAVVDVGGHKVSVEHGKEGVDISVLNQNGIAPLVKITRGKEGRLEVQVSEAHLVPDMRGSTWGQFVDIAEVGHGSDMEPG